MVVVRVVMMELEMMVVMMERGVALVGCRRGVVRADLTNVAVNIQDGQDN